MTEQPTVQQTVVDHYERPGLADVIEAALAEVDLTPATVTVDRLAAVDEFHTGGPAATEAVLDGLALENGAAVLDVGSGLGGPARRCALRHGCRVTGVDLTESYVEAARRLTGWVDLDDRVRFVHGAVEDLAADVEPDGFDAAYLLHVGMNVADKASLFSAVAARLRPGGRFTVYDLMRTGPEPLTFPLPWASEEVASAVVSPEAYTTDLVGAGFEVAEPIDRAPLAVPILEQALGSGGPPPLGLHLVTGSTGPAKMANMLTALRAGTITPIEIRAVRPAPAAR